MVERQDPDQLSLLSNAGNMRMVIYRMSLKQIWIYIYIFFLNTSIITKDLFK